MLRLGTVTSFDDHVGLGEIRAESGEQWPFHCTSIVDGSRTIATGRQVAFLIGPGGPGRWEAFEVTPVG